MPDGTFDADDCPSQLAKLLLLMNGLQTAELVGLVHTTLLETRREADQPAALFIYNRQRCKRCAKLLHNVFTYSI